MSLPVDAKLGRGTVGDGVTPLTHSLHIKASVLTFRGKQGDSRFWLDLAWSKVK